ncbi:hypothetical protein [Microbacterium sp. USHLN186]|uniref:hypothetical protein n=1 Tax=Microbacterium sp. USHLN186 TaxID=3081286 RepID=UPI00301A85ED
MSDDQQNTHARGDEEPTTEELQEPSTEKDPGQEPKAEHPDQPEPDHSAVGIGVIGGPQTDTEGAADAADAGSSDAGEDTSA